jgi:hypothetical protein
MKRDQEKCKKFCFQPGELMNSHLKDLAAAKLIFVAPRESATDLPNARTGSASGNPQNAAATNRALSRLCSQPCGWSPAALLALIAQCPSSVVQTTNHVCEPVHAVNGCGSARRTCAHRAPHSCRESCATPGAGKACRLMAPGDFLHRQSPLSVKAAQ